MEKLLEKYKEECDKLSKAPSRIWKSGQLLIAGGWLFYGFKTLNYIMAFILPIILVWVLYKICEYMELVDIIKKLNLKYKRMEILFKSKVKDEIYKSYNIFQKEWLTKYCKRSKINSIEKLKILYDELNKCNTTIKYINPVIIGTLLLIVWEVVFQNMVSFWGLWNAIWIAAFSAIILSIVIAWIKKEWEDQLKFFREFDCFSGKDRLMKLLVDRMMKVER